MTELIGIGTTLAVFRLILSPSTTLIVIGLGALGTLLWSAIFDDMVSAAGLLPVGVAGIGMITSGVGIGKVKTQ